MSEMQEAMDIEGSMKVKIPKRFKSGAYEYTVISAPDLSEDYKLLGQSLTDKETIKIDTSARYRVKCVTFWHEVLHSACDIHRIELADRDIDMLAHCLTAVMMRDMDIEFDWSDIEK